MIQAALHLRADLEDLLSQREARPTLGTER